MNVSITDAKGQLTDLVRRAEAGEEIVLTRHDHPTVRLVPIKRQQTVEERLAIIDRISKAAAAKAVREEGADAARSQDFLYDENGLPA